MKILVTGGTGNVGGKVVSELLKRRADVRVLARKQPEEKVQAGVEIVTGDLLDPVSVEQAMQGVDKLFLLNAVVADELTQALIAYGIAKMKEYGVVDSGDAKQDGVGAMTDARWHEFFDTMVKAGLYPADMDYKKAFTLQFVDKRVGMKP